MNILAVGSIVLVLVRLSLKRAHVQDSKGDTVQMTLQRSPFDLISLSFRFGMFWEGGMQPIFDTLLAQNDGIVLDIGANIGAHSVYLGKYRTVWAFEPQRETFNILQTNVSNNGVAVECFNLGLSNTKGTVEMNRPSIFNNGGTSIGKGGETIHLRRLDSVWAKHGRPAIAFVKIDVEGHEVEVFEGGVECLHGVPILFEDHDGKATRYLRTLGYAVEKNRFPFSHNDFIARPRTV